MHRDVWIKIAVTIGQVAAAVAITVFVMTTYFVRPIVVVDLQELQNYQKSQISKMKEEEAIDAVATYFRKVAENIRDRKEIVVVKQAVLNPERVRDITGEPKRSSKALSRKNKIAIAIFIPIFLTTYRTNCSGSICSCRRIHMKIIFISSTRYVY